MPGAGRAYCSAIGGVGMKLKIFLRVGATAVLLACSTSLGQAETLREALSSAYASNPNIASALISVKTAAEDIAIRRSGKLPSISATADYAYNWSVVGGSASDSQSFNIGMTYRQTLFDNLRTDAQVEQARAFTVVAAQSLRNAEQNVLLSAANAYFNVLRDTQLVQLRADNVAFFQAQVKSAQDRLNIGEGTRIEVSQAEARLASSVASYRNGVASLQVSQASYQRWVGRPPQNLSSGFDFFSALPRSLSEALALADTQHPAILSALAQLRASQAGADAARAAFGPTLDLIGTICAVQCFGGTTTGMSGSIRLTLSIPLYSGGAMGASLRQANLNQIKSELDALVARDQIRETVVSSWNGLENSNAQITSAQSSVRASEAVLAGVIEERNVGQSTTLDVLNARSDLTNAREQLISAQNSKLVAGFTLLSSIGRLSAVDLGLQVQIRSAQGYVESVEDVWADLRSLPVN